MAEVDRRPEVTENPKKRPKLGRKWERERDDRLSAHVMGPSCNCSRLKCFEVTTVRERQRLIDHFNGLDSKNVQDSMLASLIECKPVARRRPRQNENVAELHDFSYSYKVNVVRDEVALPIQFCIKAFLSVFGITESRVKRIRSSMAKEGIPPTDQRGKHNNRPRAFTEEQVQRIVDHIRSFRGRQSHYALSDTRRLFLPEELNLTKMYNMYCEQFPHHPCSQESYRHEKIFTCKFNIAFGYPRKDTCSTCDKVNVDIQAASPEQLSTLIQNKELHLRKARVFYDRKRAAKQLAQIDNSVAALAFDYAKNLSCPNISTNDAYYRRQLSLHTFNVHSLSDDKVHLFTYDETVAKKGADEVCSMLLYYFNNVVSAEVSTLELFCDSCPGQNKNWTMLRFLHHLVVHQQKFTKIRINFPIRGHSYMECDRDMAVINQKATVETPDDWFQQFKSARKNPSPFNVVAMQQDMFLQVTNHVKGLYRATPPFQTRPIREIIFTRDHPRTIQHRANWNGPFETSVLSKPLGKRGVAQQPPLSPIYQERIPMTLAKFKDLQILKTFCSATAQQFYDNIPYVGQSGDEDNNYSELSSEGED
ncbi:hypothetical protein EGW08_022732 [Elysia chlorotica]|uniref:DUF7869 domain-containing protein n=1 Tax=Elysia chlorotica TaxID=188477 RepID=A0A3S1B1A3_ELYCH|nr:hypothetical protein EGW08_022732 [Elysia chlorotica]